MEKGNPASRRSGARNLVYQVIAGRATGLQRGIQVGDPVADMVDTGTAPGQESSNGSVGVLGSKELYLGLAERKAQNGGPIGHFGGTRRHPENDSVERGRRFEVGNGDPDMGDAGAISHLFLRDR
jgi:hypothetical protein